MHGIEKPPAPIRGIILASLILIFQRTPLSAQTSGQPPFNPPSAGAFQMNTTGILAQRQDIFPGLPCPAGMSQLSVQAFFALRDDVYNGATPESVDAQATSLLKNLVVQKLPEDELALLTARISYLTGRSWNDHKNKKKAIPWFERALEAAKTMVALNGETPTALVALAEPLGELSILKDIGFLVSNGPKVGQYADKALKSDPENIKARLLKTSALAYPPPIWGGNYKKALENYATILRMTSAGLPKDVLFDIRVGIATAYANLKLTEHAAWWFASALELYPQNLYAKNEREKLVP